MKHTTAGFTLLELAIVITVLTILAVATMPQIAEDYNRTRTHLTIGEIEAFSEAARLYAYDNKGAWPGAPGCAAAIKKLKDGGYLQGVDEKSPWETNYVTGCTDKLFTITTNVTTEHKDWAGVILNAVHSTDYPVPEQKEIVRTSVVTPGATPATKRLLHRFDEGDPELNRMDTAINMDNHDINNAERVVVNTIYDKNDPGGPDIPNKKYVLDPAAYSIIHGIQSAKENTDFALKLAAYRGKEFNIDPQEKKGSLSVNDIWLRSGNDRKGQWLSDIKKGTKILLSMHIVQHKSRVSYPPKDECVDKGGDPRIVVLPGGYWTYIYDGATPPGHHESSLINAPVSDQSANLKISAFPYTKYQAWEIYFNSSDFATGTKTTGVAQVYCAY